MKSSYHKRYTVDNNLNATNNLLAAITESGLDTHVVHLGTMGVYGYGSAGMILEGYLTVKVETRGRACRAGDPLPAEPGQHLPHDQDPGSASFAYYNKNDLTRVTDLHQGIVGNPDRGDQAGRAPHKPLRLRRRLRHRPQPLPDAGRRRLPAHRPRHGRPDPRFHPHPGHRALHTARPGEPPRGATGSTSTTR